VQAGEDLYNMRKLMSGQPAVRSFRRAKSVGPMLAARAPFSTRLPRCPQVGRQAVKPRVVRAAVPGVEDSHDASAAWYKENYGIDGAVDFFERGPDTYVRLSHPNGSSAVVDLLGACVTSWKTSDGREMLYSSSDGSSRLSGSKQRGGMNLAFPQFGYGQLPRDGIVSDLPWRVVGTGYGDEDEAFDPAPAVCMRVTDTEETRAVWPHSFQIDYQINLMEKDDTQPVQVYDEEPVNEPRAVDEKPAQKQGSRSKSAAGSDVEGDDDDDGVSQFRGEQQLLCMVLVTNTGDTPMTFTTGFRPLLAVKNLPLYGRWVRVLGLGAKYYFDYSKSATPKLRVLEDDFMGFGDREVDSVHVDVVGNHDVLFCPGNRSFISIHNRKGFTDIAAWNPHEGMPMDYQGFVSLGSAKVARKVTLMPGEEWYAESAYRAHDIYWDQMPEFQKNPEILSGLDHPPFDDAKLEEGVMQMDYDRTDENGIDL